MKRPAETAGVATAIGVLIARLFGVKDTVATDALIVVVGFVPAAITWLVVKFRKPKAAATP